MTVANSFCPHCKKEIIVEQMKTKIWPLGVVKLYKPKDYYKKMNIGIYSPVV